MPCARGNTFPFITIERGSKIFFGSKNAHSLKNQLQTCSPPKKVNLAGNDIPDKNSKSY